MSKKKKTSKTSKKTSARASKSSASKPETRTLASTWPDYLAACEASRQKPSALKSKRGIWRNHLESLLGHYPIDDIGRTEFDLLKGTLREHHAKTVNNITSCLRAALNWAADRGLRSTAVPKAGFLRSPLPQIEAYTPEEYERLVTTAGGESWDPFFLVIVLLGGDAGLRPGEVRGLDWSHVDMRQKLIHVQQAEQDGELLTPKHGKTRVVPMSARLHAALQKLEPRSHGIVCEHPDHETLLTVRAHRWLLSRVQWWAKVPEKGPHTLRHTFCSILAERGVPAPTIQSLAGHSDLKTTQRYMHVRDQAKRAAVDLFDSAGSHP